VTVWAARACADSRPTDVAARRADGATDATLRIELALLDRAFRLAVQKSLISQRARPYIEKPALECHAILDGARASATVRERPRILLSERRTVDRPAPYRAPT